MRRYPWVVLAGFIAAYDSYLIVNGSPTLSTRFAQAVRHPIKRLPTTLAWIVVTCHLFDVLPVDPIRWAGGVLTPRKEVR